ncbi:phosphotransferase [Micromonospora sp. LOL_014]|uniref:phosphotransferase n=1 Tax=Micromonospora sp. LOL_014 TaxID=3345415 RepID=UPI003A85DA35
MRRLVANQFPHLANLPVKPVANGGWDNWTFHLGSEMLVRLPSAAELGDHVDAELVREVWAAAIDARWDGVDRWFHGDIAPGNPLLADGQLAAVIDFGTCGVGDPACDLAIAWTLLTSDSRQAFRARLAVDDATWARGRGWALWKTLASCSNASADPEKAEELANAHRILAGICSELTANVVTETRP